MGQIIKALPEYIKEMVAFETKMGKQTEHVDLNQQMLIEAITFISNNPRYGFYIAVLDQQNKKPVGMTFVVIESEIQWWFQSIYVEAEHRRKGNLRIMSKEVMAIAKKSNVKRMKLALEVDNVVARKAYENLGLTVTGEKFYGYDFVLKVTKDRSYFEQEKTLVVREDTEEVNILGELEKMEPVINRKPEFCNRQLLLLKGQEIVGYCEYYYEYSVWRCGATIVFNAVCAKSGFEKSVIENSAWHVYQNCKIGVGSVLFLMIEEGEKKVLDYVENARYIPYDVMSIDL